MVGFKVPTVNSITGVQTSLVIGSWLSSPFTDWTEILAYFRGSELQNYFTKILEDDLKAVIKPQYVDQVKCYNVL